jgi:hypothetical protein
MRCVMSGGEVCEARRLAALETLISERRVMI